MDVRLIEKDQQMLVALGAVQHALELLDKRLSPLRIGPAEQLLGLLPRQLASTTACFHDSLLPRQLASTTACFHDSLLPRQLASTTACFHDSLLPRQLASTTACFHDSLLPRQREAVQGCADRLAAAAAAEALAHRQPQPLQGPPWCRVGPLSGWGGGRTLGGADGVSKRRRNLSAKGGRPPVRRNPSASGPWAL